jgi:hypothetical protein
MPAGLVLTPGEYTIDLHGLTHWGGTAMAQDDLTEKSAETVKETASSSSSPGSTRLFFPGFSAPFGHHKACVSSGAVVDQ